MQKKLMDKWCGQTGEQAISGAERQVPRWKGTCSLWWRLVEKRSMAHYTAVTLEYPLQATDWAGDCPSHLNLTVALQGGCHQAHHPLKKLSLRDVE